MAYHGRNAVECVKNNIVIARYYIVGDCEPGDFTVFAVIETALLINAVLKLGGLLQSSFRKCEKFTKREMTKNLRL